MWPWPSDTGGYRGTGVAAIADAEHLTNHPGPGALHAVSQAEYLTADSPVHARFQRRARALRAHITTTLEASGAPNPATTATELSRRPRRRADVWPLAPETVDLTALYRGYLDHLFPTRATQVDQPT
ncbi:MAG TPA: hypothetical protein VM677_18150 [Actinokineospora sp.]|nr:hypothetical protein [Actinokineospora sp.]